MLLADPNPWMSMALNLNETLFGFHGCGNRHPSAAMSENKIAYSDSLDWTIPGRGQNHCSPRKTIGTEPGEPDRSSFRRLDGIDIPDVLAMMDRFWVIRFVNTKSDLIMVYGDIHFESGHLDTGAGPSASGEVIGDEFLFKHWLSPIIHLQIGDTPVSHEHFQKSDLRRFFLEQVERQGVYPDLATKGFDEANTHECEMEKINEKKTEDSDTDDRENGKRNGEKKKENIEIQNHPGVFVNKGSLFRKANSQKRWDEEKEEARAVDGGRDGAFTRRKKFDIRSFGMDLHGCRLPRDGSEFVHPVPSNVKRNRGSKK
jgi:hypothetical protein